MDDDGAGTDGHDGGHGVHNRVAGGHHSNIVQAHSIGDVHFHPGHDGGHDPSRPIIATVDINHELTTLVVDEDPPRVIPLSGALHVLTLEAAAARAVVLEAVRPVVVSRLPAKRGCVEVRLAGFLEPRPFTCDLDTDRPTLRAGGRDFPFTISPTDVERFHIVPQVRTGEIHWWLEVDWLCAGQRGTAVVDDGGEPFVLHPDVTLLSDGGATELDWGCSLFHKPGCPAQRLALRSTRGTVGVFHEAGQGIIRSDAGGDFVEFDYTAVDPVDLPHVTTGSRVEFEAVMTRGGPWAVVVRLEP